MEFEQAVLSRRAVRKYLPSPVSRADIVKLIGLSVHAPSAMNRQPWAFAVIEGAARVEELGVLAKEYYLAHEEVPNAVRAELEAPGYSIFHRAPALVLVMAKADTDQAREDCCLAAQTLMLAARDLGLGSCWVGFSRGWLNLPETRAMLKLPPRYRVVAPIVLGVPLAPEILWVS